MFIIKFSFHLVKLCESRNLVAELCQMTDSDLRCRIILPARTHATELSVDCPGFLHLLGHLYMMLSLIIDTRNTSTS